MTINNDVMFANAAALAAVTSEELSNITNAVLKAKEEWSGAPMALMFAIQHSYTPDQLDMFPIIGDKSSNNPDIVTMPGKSGKKGKEVSFYTVWPDSTPIGSAISKEIKDIQTANDKEADHSKVPADIIQMNGHQREVRMKYLQGKRASIRAAYKNAIKLMHQFQAVNQLDGVVASPIPAAEKGKYENVILVRTSDPARATLDYEHYNIGQFLRLVPAAAEEKGGSFADLRATLVRKPKTPDGTATEGKPQLIRTMETFSARVADMNEFMTLVWDGKQDKAAYGKFLADLKKDESALLNTFDLYYMLKDIAAMDELASTYSILKEASMKAAA